MIVVRKPDEVCPTMPEVDDAAKMRRWPRYKIDVRLKVVISREGPTFGRANNLSHGGMGAYIPFSIPVGARVLLEVNFPHEPENIRMNAVVRNAEGFRYGLEFVDIPSSVRTIIEKNCVGVAT